MPQIRIGELPDLPEITPSVVFPVDNGIQTYKQQLINVINTISDDVLDTIAPQLQNNLVFKTSAYTLQALDSAVVCSGASFAITLPSAVGILGKRYQIIHKGSNLTQVYSISTTSGQTIDGIASGDYKLFTNSEVLEVVSNGTDWTILYHYAETPWINSGAVTIQATTTNPTKATARSNDALLWKRKGADLHINLQYRQEATAGSAAGSGTYFFPLPSNILIDAGIAAAFSGGTTVGSLVGTWGSGVVGDNTIKRPATVRFRDNSSFYIFGYTTAGNTLTAVSSSLFQINAAAGVTYSVDFIVPAQDWRP